MNAHLKVQKKSKDASHSPRNAEVSHYRSPAPSGEHGAFYSAGPVLRLSRKELSIGNPGDRYETEADAAAEKIASGQRAGMISRMVNEEASSLEKKPSDVKTSLQRQEIKEPEETVQKEEIQKKEASGSTHEITPELESSIGSLRGGGQPLPDSVRTFFEPRFGYDFSQVRVHTDTKAAESARAMNARAFTVGKDIVFGNGEYAPEKSEGRRLLAHELVHTVQHTASYAENQTAPSSHSQPPTVQRYPDDQTTQMKTAALDERLQQVIDSHVQDIKIQESIGNPLQAAYAQRVVLLLQFTAPLSFADESILQAFINDAEQTAFNELDTLSRLGISALFFTRGFPITWSTRVFNALYIDVNLDILREKADANFKQMRSVMDLVPDYLMAHGLPVLFEEAFSLVSFELELRHLRLSRDHVIKDVAISSRKWVLSDFTLMFFTLWNEMTDRMTKAIADGTHVVNYAAYVDFIETKRQGVGALRDRMAEIRTEDALREMDNEIVDIRNIAFLQAFTSSFVSLVSLIGFWGMAKQMFAEKLIETDARIEAESGVYRVQQAFVWAYENGYFGAAWKQIWESIVAQGWEILKMAVLFLIIQFIPYLNAAVDMVMIAYAGVDALAAQATLYEIIWRVWNSKTTVALQRESARMASGLEGNVLRLFLDLLAITGALAGIRRAASKIRLENPGISEEEALQQAMRGASGREVTALRHAVIRRRIVEIFDPNNILGKLLDRRVDPKLVQQALIKGLSPQQLKAIAGEIAEVGRVEAVINYAGDYAKPISRMLEAGVPSEIVGQMMDRAFGLREIHIFETLLERTGDASRAARVMEQTTQLLSLTDDAAQLGRLLDRYQSAEQLGRLLTMPEVSNAAHLERLADSLRQAGFPSATMGGLNDAALSRLATSAVLSELEYAARLQASGKIAGLDNWVHFNAVKSSNELLDAVRELREAGRLANENTGSIIRVGREANAPIRPGTKGSMPEFDIAIENPKGAVGRTVEVTSIEGPVVQVDNLTNSIRHAADKVAQRAAEGMPIPGAHDVTIQMQLGIGRQSLRGGMTRQILSNGTVEIISGDGRIVREANLFDQFESNLSKIKNNADLDRVTLIDEVTGNVLAVFERQGEVWKRVKL